tara:strand:+ start:17957 stop:18316 length:360 start_codon:yes stop_codon:yes gene_type:complete
MKPNELIVYLKSEFEVCNANMGNLPHRFRLEEDEETGEAILPMPKEIYGDYAEVDDVISFKRASKYRIKLVNLSCKIMSKSRFIREYNSIVRQIQSPVHPLNRVILGVVGQYYLVKRNS